MAAARRRSDAALIDTLRASPERFSFFQAVRILERLGALAGAAEGRPHESVGGDSDPREEAVILRAALELAFPAAELAGLDDSGARTSLDVTLMGLGGPSGVLPSFYSEQLRRAQRDKNPAMRDFYDIFNHRALSLFVRAAEKYRLPMAVERADREQLDTFSKTLFALVGFAEATTRGRQAVPDTTLAFYSGHYSRLNRSAAALRQVLSDYFGLPVEIEQFQGRWGQLQPVEQSRMTKDPGSGSFSQLGVDTVCGSMVFDKQAAFRVIVGPLDYAQFKSFLPHSAQMAELVALTRTYAGPTLDFDVQLTLKGEEVPALQFASDPEGGAQLGWNGWLPTDGARGDAHDAVFEGETA